MYDADREVASVELPRELAGGRNKLVAFAPSGRLVLAFFMSDTATVTEMDVGKKTFRKLFEHKTGRAYRWRWGGDFRGQQMTTSQPRKRQIDLAVSKQTCLAQKDVSGSLGTRRRGGLRSTPPARMAPGDEQEATGMAAAGVNSAV